MTAIFYLNDPVAIRFDYFDSDSSPSPTTGIKLSVDAPGDRLQNVNGREYRSRYGDVGARVTDDAHQADGTCLDELNLSGAEWKEGDTVNTIDTQQVLLDDCTVLTQNISLTSVETTKP